MLEEFYRNSRCLQIKTPCELFVQLILIHQRIEQELIVVASENDALNTMEEGPPVECNEEIHHLPSGGKLVFSASWNTVTVNHCNSVPKISKLCFCVPICLRHHAFNVSWQPCIGIVTLSCVGIVTLSCIGVVSNLDLTF